MPEMDASVDLSAPRPQSRERVLLVYMLAQAIGEAFGNAPGLAGQPVRRERRRREALAWLRDLDGEDQWGTAAFCCLELDVDQVEMLATCQRDPAAVLRVLALRESGGARTSVDATASRGIAEAKAADAAERAAAVARAFSWDAVVQRDVIAEIRAEAGILAPPEEDAAEDEVVAAEGGTESPGDEPATWADVAEWAASIEGADPLTGFVDDFPKIAELYRAKLAACGGVQPPGRALRADSSLHLLAIMLGVRVAPELDAVALIGPRGLYDGSGKLGRFVAALCAGTSLREACRRADLSKRTGGIVLGACEALLGQPFRCRCGISLRAHRGWCADRVAKSPARQAIVARLVEHHATRGGMLPMVLGHDDEGRVIFTPSESRSYGPDHGAKVYCVTCHHGVRVVRNVMATCRRRDCAEAAERRQRRAAVVAEPERERVAA